MAHPYRKFPDRQFWNRAVATTPWADVFMGQPAKFRLTPDDRVASAGSCFARRIAEHLLSAGYNYELFESCHPLVEAKADDYGYGVFSCRYGNIYTTRQLRQLFDEALGVRPPIFHFIRPGSDGFVDLMRPNIGRMTFASADEARADRLYHLSCVRRMIEEMDAFVFTLGLTEAWADERANVVYGTHPAVLRETVQADHVTAINLEYGQVVADLEYVLELLARHGRAGGPRVILTVSPVALAATHQDSHVVTATTYSKAVLRAAAGKVAATHPSVDYFPSYEIFSLSQSFGQFLAEDLRDVNPRGVSVAMRAFEDMFMADGPAPVAVNRRSPKVAPGPPAHSDSLAEAECDEIANAHFGDRA
ncbi:MAG: GSCFA domain-containing protein [Dehalococcoidia bacterium]|nr:GSCFA domain-containing protein [Dehalococcoidia bacterium]